MNVISKFTNLVTFEIIFLFKNIVQLFSFHITKIVFTLENSLRPQVYDSTGQLCYSKDKIEPQLSKTPKICRFLLLEVVFICVPFPFRGGDWRSGGSCHLETLPELGSSLVPSQTWTKYTIFSEILASHANSSNLRALDVLNITHMTSRRKDGHSSLYYLGSNVGPAPIHRQDCSHWCLPGVPDAWNELLYAMFLKRETSKASNSSSFHAQV